MPLDAALFTVSSDSGPLSLGVPTLEQLSERGLAEPDAAGGVVLPVRLRTRVSTQPGTMGLDDDPQIRASLLSDAADQQLQLPSMMAVGPRTRAYNMCPERLTSML